MQQPKSFTIKYNSLTEALQTKCGVCKAISVEDLRNGVPHPQVNEYNAIWDTGATKTSISQRVVDELGLKTIGFGTNHTAGGNLTVTMHRVNIMLPMGVGISSLLVSCSDIDGPDVLIGMDVIARGDFSVTNVDGKTTFSFRMPSLETVDYVKQKPRPVEPIVREKEPGRNDPCPCGSGKKYKNCHGKQ